MSITARRLAITVIAGFSLLYLTWATVLYLGRGIPWLSVTVALAVAGVCVPHFLNMRAALDGARPPLHPLPLLVQAVATFLPDAYLPDGWSGVTAPLLGGALLALVPLRFSIPMTLAMSGYHFAVLFDSAAASMLPAGVAIVTLTTNALNLFLGSTAIYALIRLVRVTAELEQARADLAEAAVLGERLRISRDLHDGLGRSLTAIALKGDLASRLLDRDPGAARVEVAELVSVAREAAQDVRKVARGYREISLAQETHRAVALLEASGVECQVNLAAAVLPRASEEALAWAVREAVTNVLRHSRATTCSITTVVGGGSAQLEVVNDGVSGGEANSGSAGPSHHDAAEANPRSSSVATRDGGVVEAGGGLTGLRERAEQAGGRSSACRDGGAFRVRVEVPA
ncbi:sensor histidine kinase [Nonomuraea soli]|uniref:Two-component system sensor histidine kinase DesK n=1 Tax=Nonomuraea soli TaxID=1032476 RepID=A0A7W0CDW0_9ACTN|nr:histidine kinase [Nonomuraea soli]MBA2889356.1 two-component system sensor histidine kinase DesK [Nonomuraea soli]